MTRLYPPDWLDAAEAAYLLSLGESTFRDYVARGILPAGALVGGKRLWSRARLNEALDGLATPKERPVAEAIRGMRNGQEKKARGHAA
jgi:hypothetical protein